MALREKSAALALMSCLVASSASGAAGVIDALWSFDPAADTWPNHARARSGEACPRGPAACGCTTMRA